ncbi:DUF4174 domain-containing protein [Ferruginibacter sp.]|uniref:DUF4174 domain-containing protein n=1 Tax=Ferruginibacter sp. TaxID=1940288 RepID=UPI0026586D27|nr:DUF4174 domain-containing protein [Ferruginibacter sp.]
MIFFSTMIVCLSGIVSSNTDKRQLLLFTQNKDTGLAGKQLAIWTEAQAEMQERDLTITVITGNELLYKKYKVDSQTDFTVILLGKDGIEKLRTQNLLTANKLFALIDAMPMRRQEMRKKEKNQ